MNAKNKTLTLTLVLLLFSGCTARVVYDPTESGPSDPNAININTASISDLEKLPRIGRKTAEAIVEYRNANGAFRRVEQVMMIRGVSQERFAELRPLLKVE